MYGSGIYIDVSAIILPIARLGVHANSKLHPILLGEKRESGTESRCVLFELR
jgi:hypothetical protein